MSWRTQWIGPPPISSRQGPCGVSPCEAPPTINRRSAVCRTGRCGGLAAVASGKLRVEPSRGSSGFQNTTPLARRLREPMQEPQACRLRLSQSCDDPISGGTRCARGPTVSQARKGREGHGVASRVSPPNWLKERSRGVRPGHHSTRTPAVSTYSPGRTTRAHEHPTREHHRRTIRRRPVGTPDQSASRSCCGSSGSKHSRHLAS